MPALAMFQHSSKAFKCLVSRVTGNVGPSTQMDGYLPGGTQILSFGRKLRGADRLAQFWF